jgi:hypothetical protein
LQAHLGNETVFYNSAAFNLMNRFEFVSDRYASLQFQHSFEGLLFNRIPLVRKLKWRLVGTANVLWGSLSQQNIGIIPDDVDLDGVAARPFGALGDVPYVELGYGIENIFKFIRVDAIHRLTYRNRPASAPSASKSLRSLSCRKEPRRIGISGLAGLRIRFFQDQRSSRMGRRGTWAGVQ